MVAVPGGKAEEAVKTMVAALFHGHPEATAGDLSRALGATLLLTRQRVVQAAAEAGDRSLGLIGSAPEIRDDAPTLDDGAARVDMWAPLAKSAQPGVAPMIAQPAMMATALLMDAPATAAI